MQAKLQWCSKCKTFNHAVIRCHVCGTVIVFQEFECTPIYSTPNNRVHADAGDSAASTDSLQASAESTSQTVTQPTQRG